MEYTWLKPYLYCAANPVMHIDPTGELILINNIEDQEVFKQLFPKKDREFIVFDKDGFIVQESLISHHSDSWLYNSIIKMNSAQEITSINLSYGFYYKNDIGETNYLDFGEIEYEDPEFEDTEFITTGVTTGETGNMGKTLFPGIGISGQNSTDANTYVYINKRLSTLGALETIGHELFGHVYIFYLTKDRIEASHKFAPGLRDVNHKLVNNIKRARREIIFNQK